MPISRRVRVTRTAISPRLATRTLRKVRGMGIDRRYVTKGPGSAMVHALTGRVTRRRLARTTKIGEISSMAFVRGWLLAPVAASVVLLTAGSALAADPPGGSGLALPHGIYRGQNGRYYQDVCDHSFRFHCLSKRLLPETYRPLAGGGGNAGGYCDCGTMGGCGGGGSSPPMGAMAPANVLAAYQVPPSSSAGAKIVAIVDMPDANALKDLNVYRKAFGIAPLPQCPGNGLPDPTTGTPCFAAVDQSGKVTSSGGDCPSSDGETGLDEEMVSAACPDCSILL